jgi:hypothetical protein
VVIFSLTLILPQLLFQLLLSIRKLSPFSLLLIPLFGEDISAEDIIYARLITRSLLFKELDDVFVETDCDPLFIDGRIDNLSFPEPVSI